MATQPVYTRMSVEEYLALDHESRDVRYEFIDGLVYMLAGGTANHSTLAINAGSLLRVLLRGSACRVYSSDMKICIAEQRYVYPDLSVSCDPRDRGTVTVLQYPRVIVEVLSQSTEAFDRGQKFELYRTCPSLQEYILIDSKRCAVDMYRRASEKLWTLYPYSTGEQIQLYSLDKSLSVDEVYENVFFAHNTSE